MSWTAALIWGCAALAILAVMAGAAARQAWIERKIAALTASPTRDFSQDNAALPAKGDRLRVVMIGDSSIARWPAGRPGDGRQFVNRGVGGETVGQVAQRFDADALSLSPDAIVVSAGGNDLVAADFLDASARRAVVDRTVATLEDLSRRGALRGVPVLIATLPPPSRPDFLRLPVWRDSLRDSVAEVNERLRAYGAQAGVGLVDFSAALGGGDRRTPDAFRADTLHLNAAGYERLARALDQALDGVQDRLRRSAAP